ncbi:MAG: hypothetical protein AAFY60_06560, partial [Myxococcota bacterium]
MHRENGEFAQLLLWGVVQLRTVLWLPTELQLSIQLGYSGSMVFPTPKRELVAAELVLNRARLRAFARARVPTSEVDDVLQLAAVRAVE